MNKKINNIFGIILGAIAIGFAVAIFCLDRGGALRSYTFGADYYTESYNAMRMTALNIYKANTILKVGFGCSFMFLGLKSIIKNVFALVEKPKKEAQKQEEQNNFEDYEIKL